MLLLLNMQGMLDNDTTKGLTASIFGMSKLINKKIQEDNLQQLSLSSNCRRVVLRRKGEGGDMRFQRNEVSV